MRRRALRRPAPPCAPSTSKFGPEVKMYESLVLLTSLGVGGPAGHRVALRSAQSRGAAKLPGQPAGPAGPRSISVEKAVIRVRALAGPGLVPGISNPFASSAKAAVLVTPLTRLGAWGLEYWGAAGWPGLAGCRRCSFPSERPTSWTQGLADDPRPRHPLGPVPPRPAPSRLPLPSPHRTPRHADSAGSARGGPGTVASFAVSTPAAPPLKSS